MKQEMKFVTCSGANEFTNIEGMVALSNKFPTLEWGIQVSGKKCSAGTDRFIWIRSLQSYLQTHDQKIQLALHINADWVNGFTTERVSPELHMFLRMRNHDGSPLFQRVQLNFKIGRDKKPNESLLIQRIKQYGQHRRFIFSYNDENSEFIHGLYKKGLRDFDVLYDSSHGEGIEAEEWQNPAFYDENILQGYAGGLSPENAIAEITKIRRKLTYNGKFYVDAEGKLKGNEGHLSLEKCRQFVENALSAMMFDIKNFEG